VPIFVATVRDAGLTVDEVQVAAGFARLVVTDGDERTGVDIAADARLLPADRTALGLLLSIEELAVDKVLAVFGRAEARDFVDLAALEPRFGLEHLCELAVAKDAGFDRQVFFEMLGRFGRLPRDEFDVDEDTFQTTARSVCRWRHALRGGPPPAHEFARNRSRITSPSRARSRTGSLIVLQSPEGGSGGPNQHARRRRRGGTSRAARTD
jgi:hypothetical protein